MRLACAVTIAGLAGCMSPATRGRHDQVDRQLAGIERTAGAAAATAAPAPDSCVALAQAVAGRHPRVRAEAARTRAALARSRGAAALPAPRASFELWDFPVTAPDDAGHEGMYMLGVGQELPPPGVRAHEARAELELARAGLGTLAETRRQIFQEVAHACIEWSALAVVLQRLAAHRALIDVVRTALVARYRGGAGSIGEVARTEAELAAADRHVVEAEAELDAARAALLPLVAGIPLPERPPALPVRDLARPVAADATGALRRRGAVQRATALEREAEERARAATARARLPGLELRATFMHSPAERPGLGAMIAVSLPWLSGEGRALREAADHERSAARAALDDEQLQVRSQVAQAAGRVRALARSLALLLEREIPAATRALEAERAGLVGSDFNLASWIQAAHALREAHVDEARARAALEHAWIDLQAARGESPVDSAEVNHD